MAWLHSQPKEMGTTRRAWIERHFGPDRLIAFDVAPGPLAWLIDLWADAGAVRHEVGPMGGVLLALGWPEIMAWVEGAGEHDLAPLFRRGIMALSAAYAREAMAAQKIESPAPYDPGKG